MADKKENKNQKLIEKVDNVIEKLNAEKNPFKRAFYTVKLEMLNARIQKEIDIREIKEKYEKEKEERLEEANNAIRGNTKGKFNSIKTRNYYENKMEELSDFDPKSRNFAFKDELDMAGGDIEKMLNELHDSGNNEIALKIEEAIEAREKYEEAKDDLHQMKSEGFKIQTKASWENVKSTTKETAIVVAKKTNVFKTFLNAIKKGIQEFNESRKANKEFKKETYNIKLDVEERRNSELSDLEAEYQRQKEEYEEIMKKIEDKRAGIDAKYNRESRRVDRRDNLSHKYRNEEAAAKSNLIKQKFMDGKQQEETNEQPQNDEQEH